MAEIPAHIERELLDAQSREYDQFIEWLRHPFTLDALEFLFERRITLEGIIGANLDPTQHQRLVGQLEILKEMAHGNFWRDAYQRRIQRANQRVLARYTAADIEADPIRGEAAGSNAGSPKRRI